MQPPLLLLHGALGSAAQFNALLPLLPGHAPVHAFDLPGHGGSPTDGEYSMSRFADHTLARMDNLGIEQARLFGYSMGGYVALTLARKHPERVAGVVTLGTKFDWTPETAALETSRLDPEKIAAKVPAFAQLLAQRHEPADWRAVLRQTAGMLTRLGHGEALQAADFEAIHCPVCIGRGAEDSMVTEAESERTAALLPLGRYVSLPSVKHPFEQVDTQQLADWLRREGIWSF